jgi:hypothetical protein
MTTTKPHTGPLVLGEFAFRRFALAIEPGITLADLLRPEMWRLNTSGVLRPNDQVRVVSKTGAFDCILTVRSILPNAGIVMEVDETAVPGSPSRKRLEAVEASVRAEEETKHKAELAAIIVGAQL